MSKKPQNCGQGWGRNRDTSTFFVNPQVYRETAEIYFGTNATDMYVRPEYLGFAGHRLDSKTTDLAQVPLSAFLTQHWQIVVEPDFVRDGALTSKALIMGHPLWISFQASINLANKILLANDNMRSIKFRVSGLCELRFESVEMAVEFWTRCFKPLEKLCLKGPCRFCTICWPSHSDDDLSGDGGYVRGQCSHKDCLKLIKALESWMVAVNPNYRKPELESAKEVLDVTEIDEDG